MMWLHWPAGPSSSVEARCRQTLLKARGTPSWPRTTRMLSPMNWKVWKSPALGMSFKWQTTCQDGARTRHLLFFQPPGIELELWLEKNDQALPRRLIVTYRNLPDQPSYIAEFSDWNFSIHPADAAFEFTTPADAKQVELKPANAAAPARPKGAKP